MGWIIDIFVDIIADEPDTEKQQLDSVTSQFMTSTTYKLFNRTLSNLSI